jgi:hypothetical protein
MTLSLASRLSVAAMAFFAVLATWHASLSASGMLA